MCLTVNVRRKISEAPPRTHFSDKGLNFFLLSAKQLNNTINIQIKDQERAISKKKYAL